jgi:putative spermidine/putrescine transport system permease protein
MRNENRRDAMTRTITYLGVAFILFPIVTILASSVTELRYISFPPKGFTLDWYFDAIRRREFLSSFQLSVTIACLSAFGATVLGTLTSLGLRALPARWRSLALSVVLSPLVLPGVVIGISLLQFFSLARLGVSTLTLVIGHIVITVPYVVRLVSDSLSALPRNLEWASASLGASPVQTVFQVVLPCIKAGVIGGGLFAFIVSFENVTISVFLSAPQFTTLPVRIFGYTDQAIETWLVAICSIAIIFTVFLIWIIERVLGLERIFYAGKA